MRSPPSLAAAAASVVLGVLCNTLASDCIVKAESKRTIRTLTLTFTRFLNHVITCGTFHLFVPSYSPSDEITDTFSRFSVRIFSSKITGRNRSPY
jgi:hypothetical protein